MNKEFEYIILTDFFFISAYYAKNILQKVIQISRGSIESWRVKQNNDASLDQAHLRQTLIGSSSVLIKIKERMESSI